MIAATQTAQVAEVESALGFVVRAIVARRDEDPRLVEAVTLSASEALGVDVVTVRLRDGRSSQVRRDGGDLRLYGERGLIRSAAMAAGQAFAQPPVAGSDFARDGLAGDGWWRDVPVSRAAEARVWVRRLLMLPQMTDAKADLFIASLDPPKREELLRRAFYGETVEGF